MADALEFHGLQCRGGSDILMGQDALDVDWSAYAVHAIITNPPWTRQILQPMILHFQKCAPTWLLLDADWAHTRRSAPFLDQRSHIVSIGRLKWLPDSKFTGKDNAAWYRFHDQHTGGSRFIGRASSPSSLRRYTEQSEGLRFEIGVVFVTSPASALDAYPDILQWSVLNQEQLDWFRRQGVSAVTLALPEGVRVARSHCEEWLVQQQF